MSHDHAANHAPDAQEFWTEEFWNARYSTAGRIWSGNPNPHLVDQVKDLAPGTALDVGCGEGADVIWLAEQGWQVIGVDVSTVALERAADEATKAGAAVAERATFQQVDMLEWTPAPQQFDLVTSHFIHVPAAERESLHRKLAAAVRPGGTLLIVGHHPSDLATSIHRPNLPDLMFTAEEIAAQLDPAEWESIAAMTPGREVRDPAGQLITIHDAVLQAVRRR